MFHHQTEVGSNIGLALDGIDDDAFGLGRGRWTQLDEGWEAGSTHTNDAGFLDTVHNLFRRQFRMVFYQFQLVRAVDGLFPFVALNINNNHGLAIASSVNGGINLKYSTADA